MVIKRCSVSYGTKKEKRKLRECICVCMYVVSKSKLRCTLTESGEIFSVAHNGHFKPEFTNSCRITESFTFWLVTLEIKMVVCMYVYVCMYVSKCVFLYVCMYVC